jgi:ParB/RepB/Spo0J family partition protein
MPAKSRKLTYNPLEMIVSGDLPDPSGQLTELEPDQIQPNPNQPRTHHDPAAQSELEASIREAGIHEPLIVRLLSGGDYQLVAGGRRLAAARAVGLDRVPVVVRDYSDAQAEQVALVENLQRSSLRFDDEAHALLRLKRGFGLTNEAIGRSIGKSTDYVELRIAAAEHPAVLRLYMAGHIDQKQIRTAIRALLSGEGEEQIVQALHADPNGSDHRGEPGPPVAASPSEPPATPDATIDPNRSDQWPAPPAGSGRRGRRPPDGWRWTSDAERRLQQLPERAARMDAQERARARVQLLRLREATDRVLDLLAE